MAELTLRIVVDPATGRRELVVEMTRDADALPAEHEEAHRRLVEALAPGRPLERAREEAPAAAPEEAPEAEAEKLKE